MSKQAALFLQKAQFKTEELSLNPLVSELVHQMEQGLKGQATSLAMLPTHICPHNTIITNRPVIVLDAGGTHLRVALAQFGSDGKIKLFHKEKHSMPGRDSEVSAVEFYGALCDHLSNIIDKTDQIGFCFSYPCKINSKNDGQLLYWTKEIKAPLVVGQWIGDELKKQIKSRFRRRIKIALLNDTVATLLSGKSLHSNKRFDAYAGLILGTGTNCAYSERNTNIPAIDVSEGHQIINMESGNFDGGTHSLFDRQLDLASENPGSYFLEKKVGGLYLGPLLKIILVNAIDQSLLHGVDAKIIRALSKIQTSELSDILAEKKRPTWYSSLSKQGQAHTLTVVNAIRDRAAWLTAVNVAGGLIKSLGLHPSTNASAYENTALKSCLITIDGSTYYNTPELKTKVEKHLHRFFSDINVRLTFCQVHDAPLVGSAIAIMSA